MPFFLNRVLVLVWLQLPWFQLYRDTFQDQWLDPMIMKELPYFACYLRTICGLRQLKLVQYCGQLCQLWRTSIWFPRGEVMSFSSIWFHCMCWHSWWPAGFHIAFMWPIAFCIVLEPFYQCKFHLLDFNRFKVPNTCW